MFFTHISNDDKLLFTKHMAVMLKSGIPVSEVLEILEKQASNPAFKNVIRDIHRAVSSGNTLESALTKHPRVFDPLYRSLVKIGEETGTLEKNLSYLSSLLSKQYEFQKKVQSAMLYPIFILVIATVVGGGVSIFVLPKLADLFDSLDTALPPSTMALMWFAGLMRDWGILIGLGAVLLFVLGILLIRSKQGKPYWDRFLLRLPIMSKFIEFTETARFARNFSILLESGVPIHKGLAVLADTTHHSVYHSYIQEITHVVTSGKLLSDELIKPTYKHFPPLVSRMVGVGEKSGKLSESLAYVASFFEEEVDNLTKNLPTVLEPILLTIIALIAGFLALAVITPIYNLTGSIAQ